MSGVVEQRPSAKQKCARRGSTTSKSDFNPVERSSGQQCIEVIWRKAGHQRVLMRVGRLQLKYFREAVADRRHAAELLGCSARPNDSPPLIQNDDRVGDLLQNGPGEALSDSYLFSAPLHCKISDGHERSSDLANRDRPGPNRYG